MTFDEFKLDSIIYNKLNEIFIDDIWNIFISYILIIIKSIRIF